MSDYSGQARFGDYNPPDFGWPHQVPNLVPLSFDGVSFGSCARDAHPVFIALLTELVPNIQGGLHAGSCGGYSTTDDLPDGSWSFHRYGIAIDVNWNVNKMGVPNPATGEYAIPHAAASQIARKYGCEYGGDWTAPKDWMHFEVHLPPSVARTVQVLNPPTPEDDMSAADVAAINKHTDEQIAALRAEVDHTAQGLAAAISAVIHGDGQHPNSLDSLAAGILGQQPDSLLSTLNRLWNNDFQGVDATRQDLKAIADKLGVVLPVPPTGGQ